MRMWVQIPAGMRSTPRKRGMGAMVITEITRKIDATVFRLARIPTVKRQLVAAVEADVFVPEMYRTHIAKGDPRWVAPGVFRTKLYWVDNQKSRVLGQFLASGALEIDLRDEA